MAVYVVPASRKESIGYTDGDYDGSLRATTRLEERGPDNGRFTVGEDVFISFGDGNGNTWVYRGTIDIDGESYPVLQSKNGRFHYIVGTGSHKKVSDGGLAPDTIGSHNISAVEFVLCFFPGTLIATPSGERKVEELASGDLVLIGDSGAIPSTWLGRKFARAVSVKWIGRQTVSTLFGPAERLMPVRFAAGSLGGGGGQLLQPHSDLTVTADHAMLVDGVLCEAGALVNGTTITRVPLSDFDKSYTVYHVETEAHEIILANGVAAETFVDNVSRRAFDNFAKFERLHGDPPEMKELPYPRASNARHLPARIKARLGLDLRAQLPRRSAH